MNRNVVVQILGFAFVILIVIVFFVFLFKSAPSNDEATKTEQTVSKPLQDYANTTASVTLTSAGAIVGNEDYREIRIIVDKNVRTLQIIQGYQNTVISTSSFPNNEQAYRAFLASLQVSGYARERVDSPVKNSEGQCSSGTRYFLDASGIENFPDNLWTSNCGNKIGTFGGNFGQVEDLYQAQIPNYSRLVENVSLN